MSTLQDATTALRELEAALRSSSRGDIDPAALADRVRAVRQLLSDDEAKWVGTTEAKRLLDVGSENTVKAWARLGLFRSRRLPNGRIQVLLDDVLRRRAEADDLDAIGGDEMSPDELRVLRETRPGTNPWERSRTDNHGLHRT